MPDLTPADVAVIEERCKRATRGPWKNEDNVNPDILTTGVDESGAFVYVVFPQNPNDAPFIQHSIDDIPALIAAPRSRRGPGA